MTTLSTATSQTVKHTNKPIHTLKRKPRVKNSFRRLPFVATRPTYVGDSCWQVPATGGYFGGYKAGESMAVLFLKMLREDPDPHCDTRLTNIVHSLMWRYEQEGGNAMASKPFSDRSESFSSFHGQCVGFFNTLTEWLTAAARRQGAALDHATEADLVRIANAGICFDEEAFMKSVFDSEKD